MNLYIMKLDWLDCMCNDIIILFIYRNERRETTLWRMIACHLLNVHNLFECIDAQPLQWQFCSEGYLVFNCMQIGFDAKNMKLTRKDRHNKSININRFLNQIFFEEILKYPRMHFRCSRYRKVRKIFLFLWKKNLSRCINFDLSHWSVYIWILIS